MTWLQTLAVWFVALWVFALLVVFGLIVSEIVDHVRHRAVRREVRKNLERATGRPYEGQPWCFTMRPEELPDLEQETDR